MMRKSQHAATPGKQRAERRSAQQPLSTSAREKPGDQLDERVPRQQWEALFACFPDALIMCNQEGKILRLNAVALQLFELASERPCQGKDVQEFLASSLSWSEQPCPLAFLSRQSRPAPAETAPSCLPGQALVLQVPSGRKVEVDLTCSTIWDNQHHVHGTVLIFHERSPQERYALHFQRVSQAVFRLNEAIVRLPEKFPEEIVEASTSPSWLLSPPVIAIAQQLVDVIRQVLACDRVSLKALGGSAQYLHFVAGSGFSAEQEEPERTISDLVTLSDVFDEGLVAQLQARQEIIVRGDRVHLPPGLGSFASDNILIMPLFLQERFIGMLCILKAGLESVYTLEEVEVVKAIATQAMLLVECLYALSMRAEAHLKEQALQEVHRLSQDFLTLVSHELSTPLTGIVGNLQLAWRRLETLQQQIAAQHGPAVCEHFLQARQPLASASHSAQLQQRMINDIIDDARLQTNRLRVHLQQCDLLCLLKTTLARYQHQVPGHPIVLETRSESQQIPVLADAERTVRVLTTYLANALASAPASSPVTIQVNTEDRVARVAVHNEGPGIPDEEQRHLWERFYRAKWGTVQQELDLSLGLGLYLCRALIEHQRGHVGVQSAPDQGATFWFTLPRAT